MKRLMKSYASRVIRFIAREFTDEVVSQLASSRMKSRLVSLFAWNHRWIALLSERNRRNASDTYDFIQEAMPNALFTIDQFQVIRSKKGETLKLGGHILDLGVHKGASTRALARIYPNQIIHGFDSFEGLPEDWTHLGKGFFGDVHGALPNVPKNVRLYKGWFEDTLPVWFKENNGRPISLLRVDCDLYSSTKTIFDVLEPLIVTGTWIVFDELIGYQGWRDHEYRAFLEFIDRTSFNYEFVAYGLTYTIVRLVS